MTDVERIRALAKCTSVDRCIAIETNLRSSALNEALNRSAELSEQFLRQTEPIRQQLTCCLCCKWLGSSRKPPQVNLKSPSLRSLREPEATYTMCLTCHDAPLMCHGCFAETHMASTNGHLSLSLPMDKGLLLGEAWEGSPNTPQAAQIARTYFLEVLGTEMTQNFVLDTNSSISLNEHETSRSKWSDVLLADDGRNTLDQPHVVLDMLTLDPAVAEMIRSSWLALLRSRILDREDAMTHETLERAADVSASSSLKAAGYEWPVRHEATDPPLALRLKLELAAVLSLESSERSQLIRFQCMRLDVARCELLEGEEATQRCSLQAGWQQEYESLFLTATNARSAFQIRGHLREMIRCGIINACATVLSDVREMTIRRVFAEEYLAPLEATFEQEIKPAIEEYRGVQGTVAHMWYAEGIARRDVASLWRSGAEAAYRALRHASDMSSRIALSSQLVADHCEFGAAYFRMYFSTFVLLVATKFLDRQHVNYIKAKQRSETLMFQCGYSVDRAREVLSERQNRHDLKYCEKIAKCCATEESARRLFVAECWLLVQNDLGTQQRMNRLVLERLFVSERRDMLHAFWSSTRMDGYTILQHMTHHVSPKYAVLLDTLEHTCREWLMRFVGERYGLQLVEAYSWNNGSERLMSLFWNFPAPPAIVHSHDFVYAGSAAGVHLVVPPTPTGAERSIRRGEGGVGGSVPSLQLSHQGSIVRSLKASKEGRVGGPLTPAQRSFRQNKDSSSSLAVGAKGESSGSPDLTPWSTPRRADQFRAMFANSLSSSRADRPPSFLSIINSANRVPARSSRGFMTALSLMESMVVWSKGCASGHDTIRTLGWRDEFSTRWASYEPFLLSRCEGDWDSLLYEREMSHFARFEQYHSSHNLVRLKAATPSFLRVKHSTTPTAIHNHDAMSSVDAHSSTTGPTPRLDEGDAASSSGGNMSSSRGAGDRKIQLAKESAARGDDNDLDSPNEHHRRVVSQSASSSLGGHRIAASSLLKQFATVRRELLSETEQSFGRQFLFGPNMHQFDHPPERPPTSTYQSRHDELKRRAHAKWEIQDQKKSDDAKTKRALPKTVETVRSDRSAVVRPSSASLVRQEEALNASPMALSATMGAPEVSFIQVSSDEGLGNASSFASFKRTGTKSALRSGAAKNTSQLLRVQSNVGSGTTGQQRRLTVEVNKLESFRVDFSTTVTAQ